MKFGDILLKQLEAKTPNTDFFKTAFINSCSIYLNQLFTLNMKPTWNCIGTITNGTTTSPFSSYAGAISNFKVISPSFSDVTSMCKDGENFWKNFFQTIARSINNSEILIDCKSATMLFQEICKFNLNWESFGEKFDKKIKAKRPSDQKEIMNMISCQIEECILSSMQKNLVYSSPISGGQFTGNILIKFSNIP